LSNYLVFVDLLVAASITQVLTARMLHWGWIRSYGRLRNTAHLMIYMAEAAGRGLVTLFTDYIS